MLKITFKKVENMICKTRKHGYFKNLFCDLQRAEKRVKNELENKLKFIEKRFAKS